jgi:hypothetical protein
MQDPSEPCSPSNQPRDEDELFVSEGETFRPLCCRVLSVTSLDSAVMPATPQALAGGGRRLGTPGGIGAQGVRRGCMWMRVVY